MPLRAPHGSSGSLVTMAPFRVSRPPLEAHDECAPGMLLPRPPFDSAELPNRGSLLIAMNNGWSFLFNRLRTAPVSRNPPPSS